jgi:hypothetical protein
LTRFKRREHGPRTQGFEPCSLLFTFGFITVAVTGTVTDRNDAGMLVVRATKVEVR